MTVRTPITERAHARQIVGVALLLLLADTATADSVRFAITARDPGATRLISYEILGPRNHSLPIAYVSTQRFATWQDEFLVVLPLRRYSVISEYTQARLDQTDCPGKELIGVEYAVRITKHDKPRTEHCILQKAMACDYLAGVLELSGIEWRATERKRIADFTAELRCN
jgi:hypothetical protein